MLTSVLSLQRSDKMKANRETAKHRKEKIYGETSASESV